MNLDVIDSSVGPTYSIFLQRSALTKQHLFPLIVHFTEKDFIKRIIMKMYNYIYYMIILYKD